MCYALQGIAGIVTLAVVLAIIIAAFFAVTCLVEIWDLPRRFGRAGRAVRGAICYSFYAMIGAACLFVVADFIWYLGGETLHRLFHYCVG